ncbi:hypothetical protein RHS01_10626 [Rhizoctonia solani]|uniref:Uncharacterized protein n=1 Tax=Rhizoctonia solani TaxID=456999 RepID=A0A8H7M0D4_9AGAM|nr:hypothetical protein RHS01_10626 [Rhizoctonia solani]
MPTSYQKGGGSEGGRRGGRVYEFVKGAKVIKATFLERMSRQEAHKFIVKHGHPFGHKYNMYFNPYGYVPKDPKAVARIHPPGECGVDWQLLYAMGCCGDYDLYNSTRGKIWAVAKAFACRIVERRQLETITWGDFGSSDCKEFYDGCYKAFQAKGYDPKRTKPREQDNNLCRNASKLAHKDVIPPKDEDPYYINVPEGGYGNGPKRLAKFKRSDSPSCGRSLSTQLPPSTSSRIATLVGQTRSFRRKKLALRRPSPSQEKASCREPAANANSPPRQAPRPSTPRDRPSPSPPQDSPPSPSPPPPPARSPTKTPRSIVEVVLRSPAPVKPMEPCRKEPSKPAADPKETRRLKRKAENDRDEPATKRQQPSRVVEPAVDKEAGEQGPSKRKISPETRSHPRTRTQVPAPPTPTPASESAPAAQPQPQPEGGKEHPDGGDGASSTKPSAPKPRESTPAPDSPPTPKQTKRGRSRNIPDVGASIYLVN